MNKLLLLALSLISCSIFAAQSPMGKLIVTNLPSAPFPHPDRAAGHHYDTNFFSAEQHYSNSTVVIFVPPHFKPGKSNDFVVHFHGWSGIATNAINKYHLLMQMTESQRNAILVVPQGPYDAQDSFDGKLEDP